jgi:hypothetical protein
MYGILESRGSIIVVCECCGSVMNMYKVLKNCGSVIVVCEYKGSVVDVYWEQLKEGECGDEEEREELRRDSCGEKSISLVV